VASVDDRIVSIEFENTGFERKLGETIASLDRLSEAIKLVGANQGFEAVTEAADSFDTSNMASAIDNISSKFTALGAIGFSVIQQLTQNVLSFVQSTVSEDILGPIITGGRQRALNIEQAKFQFRGLGVDVASGMESALAAVKGTAFGLDEAAKAASQLSASGIQTGDEMTGILRGIAGTAAMTGSSFSEMADIFTASAGSGKVNTQDLLQFSTRGLNAAAALAKQMGKTEAQVREMASEGKLDFKTFATAMNDAFGEHATKANETYEGSLANLHAAMSRLGASFFGTKLEQQKEIFNALTPVIDKVNAALQPLIKAFLDVTAVGTVKFVDFLNKLDLSGFTASIPNFADALKNAFAGLGQVLGAIKGAFRDIFPKSTVSLWVTVSEAVKAFSEHLKMGGETADKVKSIFRGIFAIMEIGWTIFKELILVIKDLVGAILPASTGFLDLGASGGDFLTRMNELLVGGGKIHEFFEKLREVVKGPIEFIKELGDKIKDLAGIIADFFSNLNIFGGGADVIDSGLGRVDSRMDQMRDTADKVSEAWHRLMDRLQGVFEVFDKVWDYIKNWFSELGNKIADAFKPGDFNAAVDIVNVGLLGGIAFMLHKFIEGGVLTGLGKGLADKLGGVLDTITQKTQAMTNSVKADTLLKIAGAIAILTASVVVLSLIDSAALAKALLALAVGFAELVVVMEVMDKLFAGASSLKLGILGVALVELSVSMLIMAAAIRVLAGLSWEELKNGLNGMAIGLGLMIGTLKILGKDPGGMIRAGLAMIVMSTGLLILSTAVRSFASLSWGDLVRGLLGAAIGLQAVTSALKFMPAEGAIAGLGLIEVAIGLNILAGAVKLFSLMDWGDMARGLVGVGVGVAVIAAAMNAMPAMSAISGIGFIMVAVGLNILYEAVNLFAGLSWGDLLKGIVGITAALLIITAAMEAMPLTILLTGPALIVVAIAMGMLAEALKIIGTLSLGDVLKGILGFAAMLLILAIGVNAMSGALPGAAALVVVAGAMTILTHVLKSMAELSWDDLLRGLIGIAAVLAILGISALLMEPLLPALFGLGLALGVVGVAFALFGVGAMLFAKSFEVMAESGVAGAKAFVEAIQIVITAIPEIMKSLVLAFIGSSTELLAAVPLMIRVVGAILSQLLDTIIELAPKLADALIAVLSAVFKILREKFPEYVQVGFEMLMELLRGIRDNIGEITTVVVEIVTNFIDALTEKLPDIVQAVYDFLIELATQLAEKSGELQTAFIPIGQAFIDGLLTGMTNNLSGLLSWFTELPGKIIDLLKSLFGIDSPSTKFMEIGAELMNGLFWGVVNTVGSVMNFFLELPGKIFGWIGDAVSTLVPKGWDFIVGLLQGIGQKEIEILNWFKGLGGKILGWIGDALGWLKQKGMDVLQGLLNGIIDKWESVKTWVETLPDKLKSAAAYLRDALYDIGHAIIHGLWQGILDAKDWFVDKMKTVGGWVTGPIETVLSVLSPSKVMAEIGGYVAEGLALGIMNNSSMVEKSSAALGDSVLSGIDADNLTKTIFDAMKKVNDQLSGMDEFNPVITPVLDLTRIQEDSANLEKYMRLSPITPDISLDRARLVAAANAAATEPITPPYTGPTEVTFEQNIYSPTELSTNDIYRNTKSQIAMAKEKLGIT
jgi:tape measure domain-containing protein